MPTITTAATKDPLASTMSHALDSDLQGPVRQLRRPGDNAHNLQSAANASPQVRQLKATEAAANAKSTPAAKTNETGLPEDLKSGIESLSGFSLDHVRVHYNSSKPAKVNALAFAEGSEIHVAPGQEQHLPEEAWHIVQQMQGRVKATTEIKGAAVNTDASLEREAVAMGAKAMNARQNSPQNPLKAAASPAAQVKQLKSEFTDIEADDNVKSPIKALSDHLKPYFDKAKVTEMYYFHDNKILSPSAYNLPYKRARSVTAEIDKSSTNKKSKRTDNIIQHYGHLGVMERSIMGRPDRGNLFDGGHLIERSLMSGDDADVHGNLAPQEGKEFNQDLMRGWEHLPEYYNNSKTFTYRMKLGYTQDQYTRTGAELLEAGIVHNGLLDKLKRIPETTHGDWAEKLKQTSFTFDTWVPYEWKGKITADKDDFPEQNLNKGSHFDKLEPSREEARNRVVSFDPGNTNSPILTNAGVVSGFITDTSTSSISGHERLHFGGKKVIKSYMYSGVPQPLSVQPINDRNGKAPVSKLPSMSSQVDILTEKFELDSFFDTLGSVSFKAKNRRKGKNIKGKTYYSRLKKTKEVTAFRKRANEDQIFTVAKKIRKLSEEKQVTTRDFHAICMKSLKEDGKKFVSNMIFDRKFEGIDEDPEDSLEEDMNWDDELDDLDL